jgi:glycosyltransferase involved in cell wall biosynthesis
MRILMLAQFYAPIIGGEERMVESLSVALANRGHDVAVATLRHRGLAAQETRDGVSIHRLPGVAQRIGALYSETGRRHAPPFPDPETTLALRRVIALERPDVIHGHNWLSIAYLPLRRRDPAAYVLSLHEYSLICANKRLMRKGEPCSGPGLLKCVDCAAFQYGRVVGPPVAALTMLSGRAQRRAVDLFLPVSGEVAARCGLARSGLRFEVAPNFIVERDAPATLQLAGLDRLPQEPFVLYVGDLAADKGIMVLLEAHRLLRARVPLVLIGRAAENHPMPKQDGVIELGLLPHDAVLAAWRRCALGVVPSITPDAFPTVAL